MIILFEKTGQKWKEITVFYRSVDEGLELLGLTDILAVVVLRIARQTYVAAAHFVGASRAVFTAFRKFSVEFL